MVSRRVLQALLLSLFIAVTLRSEAQDMLIGDTVTISALTVTAAASERQTPYTVFVIDPALMAGYMDGDLATFIRTWGNLKIMRRPELSPVSCTS